MWRLPLALLVTMVRCAPGVALDGITAAQRGELDELLATSAEAFASLAAGSRARDEMRLLHGKLSELSDVAAHARPREWDAMLHSLLRDEHCGAAALRRALHAEGRGDLLPLAATDAAMADPDAAARACGLAGERAERALPDGAGAGSAASATAARAQALPGRRILQADAPVAEEGGGGGGRHQLTQRGAAAAGESFAEAASEAAGGVGGGRLSAHAWRRWLLDRPPPWERDCDCCFEVYYSLVSHIWHALPVHTPYTHHCDPPVYLYATFLYRYAHQPPHPRVRCRSVPRATTAFRRATGSSWPAAGTRWASFCTRSGCTRPCGVRRRLVPVWACACCGFARRWGS